MEELIEVILSNSEDEKKYDTRYMIHKMYEAIEGLCKMCNFNNSNIILMDMLLNVKRYNFGKDRRKFIKLIVLNSTVDSILFMASRSFIMNCSDLTEQFYMRSVNLELIDEVCPDYKKIKICDILPDLGIKFTYFKSDYDIYFIY